MARITLGLVCGFLIGSVVTLATGACRASSSTEPSDEVRAVAEEVGLDSRDLQGALNSQPGVDIRDYLRFEGLLPERLSPAGAAHVVSPAVPPAAGLSAPDWPIGGALGQRIFCIEGIESRHGAAMWNPVPVWNGEHAQGWLGFLPSTARAWGAVIGNRASEWAAAARMLQAGQGRQFAGVLWGRC